MMIMIKVCQSSLMELDDDSRDHKSREVSVEVHLKCRVEVTKDRGGGKLV